PGPESRAWSAWTILQGDTRSLLPPQWHLQAWADRRRAASWRRDAESGQHRIVVAGARRQLAARVHRPGLGAGRGQLAAGQHVVELLAVALVDIGVALDLGQPAGQVLERAALRERGGRVAEPEVVEVAEHEQARAGGEPLVHEGPHRGGLLHAVRLGGFHRRLPPAAPPPLAPPAPEGAGPHRGPRPPPPPPRRARPCPGAGS